MLDAYIYDGLRTPFGRNVGALAKVRPDDMLGGVIKAVVERSPFDPSAIDDVNVGCGNQAGEDSRCVARHATLLAGLPIEVPGSVVQRNCGSGMNAIMSAAHAITCGEGDVFVAGVAPRIMGFGPVPAARKALERAGLTLADMDVIEVNEAFAAQVLACLKGLDLELGDSRVNPNGGAIAIGHPLGASGTRLALTATRQLHRTGGRYALVSMCIGIGQGIAMVLERTWSHE